MQAFPYRGQLDVAIVFYWLMAAASDVPSYIRLAYVWLRFRRRAMVGEWETAVDRYCERYQKDREISKLLDEYFASLAEGFEAVMFGDYVTLDDALPPALFEACEKIEAAIRERLWPEFPKLRREKLAHRRYVREIARHRARALISHVGRAPVHGRGPRLSR